MASPAERDGAREGSPVSAPLDPKRAAPSARRRRQIRATAALCALLVAAALGELATRVRPAPRLPLPPHYDPGLLTIDWVDVPGGGRAPVYRPGQMTFHCYDRTAGRARTWDREGGAPDGTPVGCLLYRISERGFRDVDESSPSSEAVAPVPRTIAVVGDSFTFGEGVMDAERTTGVLASRLAARFPGDYRVLNRGLQGLNLELALGLYRARVRDEHPDVVVYAFVPNDAQPFGETIHDETFLRATPWRMPNASDHGWCRVCALVTRRFSALATTRNTISHVRASFAGASGERFDALLTALAHDVAADGARFLVLEFPMTPGMSGDPARYSFGFVHEHLAAMAAKLGVPLVEVYPAIESWPRERVWAHPTDPHPSAELHALAADALAERIQTDPRR